MSKNIFGSYGANISQFQVLKQYVIVVFLNVLALMSSNMAFIFITYSAVSQLYAPSKNICWNIALASYNYFRDFLTSQSNLVTCNDEKILEIDLYNARIFSETILVKQKIP